MKQLSTVLAMIAVLSRDFGTAKEPVGENKWFNGPALVKTAKATVDFHVNVGKGNCELTGVN